MLDYETLRLLWWALLGILLIGFAIMDGFDLGAAMLLPFVGRTDDERRVLDGIPGLSDLPVVGRLFAHSKRETQETDIVLTLTPHIIRVLDLSEEDLRPFKVGGEGTGSVLDLPIVAPELPTIPGQTAPVPAPVPQQTSPDTPTTPARPVLPPPATPVRP